MSRWREQPIYIWFCDKHGSGDENCLPYNPESFYIHSSSNNEEIDMLKGPISIIKLPKLIEYEPIESFFAHPDVYRYMRSKDGENWSPDEWCEFFQDAMSKRRVLELTITGINWVDDVTVEDFQYGKKAGVEKDTYFSLKIKQHKEPVVKTENITVVQYIPPAQDISNLPAITPTGGGISGGGAPKAEVTGADAYISGGLWNGISNSNVLVGNLSGSGQISGVENMPVSYSVVGEAISGYQLTDAGNEFVKNARDLIDRAQHWGYVGYDDLMRVVATASNDRAVNQNFITYCLNEYGTATLNAFSTDKAKRLIDNFALSLIDTSDLGKTRLLSSGGSLNQTQKKAVDINSQYQNTNYNQKYTTTYKDNIIQVTTKADATSQRYDPINNSWSTETIKAGTTYYTTEKSLINEPKGNPVTSLFTKVTSLFSK